VLFLLVSILYEVAQDKLEINRNTENLLELTERGRILQIENAQLESYVSGGEDGGISDEFVERRARDEFGYADPQERVFYAN
jgi:cell division protein FtsB